MEALEAVGRCGAWALTARNDSAAVALPMRCRRWACPRCGPAMRRRLVHLTAQTGCTRMVTLTADVNAFPDAFSAARRLAWAFPKLIAAIRKRYPGETFEYLAIWERTRQGFPHLHVALTGPFIPQRWLSSLWASLAASPVVDVRHLGTPGGTGRYLAKYLAKDPDPFLQGRAFRASRGFFPEPMRPQGGRACTFGPLHVYEGTVWDWLQERLGDLWLADVSDSGLAVARPWASVAGVDAVKWLRWDGQRAAVASRERPPPTGDPPDWSSIFIDRTPDGPETPTVPTDAVRREYGSSRTRPEGASALQTRLGGV